MVMGVPFTAFIRSPATGPRLLLVMAIPPDQHVLLPLATASRAPAAEYPGCRMRSPPPPPPDARRAALTSMGWASTGLASEPCFVISTLL